MKKSIYMVLLMVTISLQMALAQRTLDNDTRLPVAESPNVTQTLAYIQNGYQVKEPTASHAGVAATNARTGCTTSHLVDNPDVRNFNGNSPKREAEISPEIVREDRIWTYYQEFNGEMEPSHDIYVNVRFSGTTEIGGKTYHNCYAWKEGTEFSESESPIIAYMREEDGKVYAYYHFYDDPSLIQNILDNNGIDIMHDCPASYNYDYGLDSGNCERLLFDFNLSIGDTLWFNKEELKSGEAYMILEDVYDQDFNGNMITTHRYTNGAFWNYDVLKGFGASVGLLPFPGAKPMCYCETGYYLVRVTDLEKDILFATPLGVDDLAESAEVLESRYYDLQGRSLNGPTDGVYVKVDIFADGHRKVTKHVK